MLTLPSKVFVDFVQNVPSSSSQKNVIDYFGIVIKHSEAHLQTQRWKFNAELEIEIKNCKQANSHGPGLGGLKWLQMQSRDSKVEDF